MSCDVDITLALREHGRRFTPQRLKVALALRHAGGHRTAEEIHALVVDAEPGVPLPLSTVYRALDVLKELRLVAEVDAGGRGAFEWVNSEQLHHHLVCRRCGVESPLAPSFLERLTTDIHAATGFEPHLDHFAITGLCAACASSEKR